MTNGHITLNVADVVYDAALYARASFDQETVNRYRLAIDQLPPILSTRTMF
jgi:hypothetical protein